MKRRWLKSAVAIMCAIALVGLGTSEASAVNVSSGKLPRACIYYGVFLGGKVQVVTSTFGRKTDRIPTFTVQRVSSFADLKVKEVPSFPDSCGKWKYVTSFPDFKVRFVNSFPDFKVTFVNSFPGVN